RRRATARHVAGVVAAVVIGDAGARGAVGVLVAVAVLLSGAERRRAKDRGLSVELAEHARRSRRAVTRAAARVGASAVRAEDARAALGGVRRGRAGLDGSLWSASELLRRHAVASVGAGRVTDEAGIARFGRATELDARAAGAELSGENR